MSPNGPGAPKLSAEEYFNVTTQMLAEVWDPARYGNHTELWFDGGLVGWSAPAVGKISRLMAQLQPNAVAFQGPTKTQAIRWIGNENGAYRSFAFVKLNAASDGFTFLFHSKERWPFLQSVRQRSSREQSFLFCSTR